jgi:hypothetical protein
MDALRLRWLEFVIRITTGRLGAERARLEAPVRGRLLSRTVAAIATIALAALALGAGQEVVALLLVSFLGALCVDVILAWIMVRRLRP